MSSTGRPFLDLVPDRHRAAAAQAHARTFSTDVGSDRGTREGPQLWDVPASGHRTAAVGPLIGDDGTRYHMIVLSEASGPPDASAGPEPGLQPGAHTGPLPPHDDSGGALRPRISLLAPVGRRLPSARPTPEGGNTRRTRAELREARDLLASLFDIVDMGIVVCGDDGAIASVNDGLARIVRRPPDALIGRSLLEVAAPEDRMHLAERRALLMAGRPLPPAEFRAVLGDGGHAVCSITSRLLAGTSGRPLLVSAIADLTRQKRLERELVEREEQLLAIADNMPALIGLIDGDGRVQFVNRPYCDWFGRPREAFLGRPMAEILPERTYRVFAAKVARAMAGETVGFGHRIRLADGSQRHFRFSYIPRRSDERNDGFYGFAFDVTALEEAKAELCAAKDRAEAASHAKSQFLANMSHELRTPLNAIIGFSDMMARELLGPVGNDSYRGYVNDILGSAHHLHALINDILDLAKIEAGRFTLDESELVLGEIVAEALQFVRVRAAEAGIAVDNRLPAAAPVLRADPRAVTQMLANLLTNAVKFTPPGGTIAIALRRLDDGLAIDVEDTGIGIPADRLSDITKPFVQVDCAFVRRHRGTGIGLTITDTLMRLHGGALSMTSREGIGTRASLIFPPARVGLPA